MTKKEENLQSLNTTSKPVFKIKLIKKEVIESEGIWYSLQEHDKYKKLTNEILRREMLELFWGKTRN